MATHRTITTGVFYKGVTKELKSPVKGTYTYVEGRTVTADTLDTDPSVSCGHGINFSRTIAGALRFGPVVVEVTVASKDVIVDTGDKLRALAVRVGKMVDLVGANLVGANLVGADLRDANLGGAYLRGVNLRDANLIGADLTGANLMDANLGGANLTGANLRDADLRDANLRGAELRGADLKDANLGGARGVPFTGMPAGWKLDDSGLWVKA